jgi:hypothetical protein
VKRAIALALASLFIFAGVAQAATYSWTGTVSHGSSPAQITFTTNTAGDVTARAVWNAKPSGLYGLRLWNSVTTQSCEVSWTEQPPVSAGDYTCTITDGQPGPWTAQFFVAQGSKVNVTLTVTAP